MSVFDESCTEENIPPRELTIQMNIQPTIAKSVVKAVALKIFQVINLPLEKSAMRFNIIANILNEKSRMGIMFCDAIFNFVLMGFDANINKKIF